MELGTAGKLYGVLRKNRGGTPNIDASFAFNGTTGRIEPGDVEDDLPEDEELF